ncbi:MAG: hypothetical protein WAU71_09560 [Pyrinomonadaceae bacterium]
MSDFIVYNNPDSVGDLYKKAPLSVFTNKRISKDVIGSRVWLIAGDGKPRRFLLRCYFYADDISSGSEHGFATCISGTSGVVFDPMIEIPQSERFLQFKKDQGNFAFGFNPIKTPNAVIEFERLAGIN